MSFPDHPKRSPITPLRVLVVDDEHLVADTLALILAKSGHDSLAVYSGSEAMGAMQRFNPHVVLSDVMMPGMNGFELARYTGENLPACKVLLMSGFDNAAGIAEQYKTKGQFLEVLTKPVLPQRILAFMARCAEDAAQG